MEVAGTVREKVTFTSQIYKKIYTLICSIAILSINNNFLLTTSIMLVFYFSYLLKMLSDFL